MSMPGDPPGFDAPGFNPPGAEPRVVGLPFTAVEMMLAELIAALINEAASYGHMPEHAVHQAMLAVQTSARKAFAISGLHSTYEDGVEFEIKHPPI